MQEIYRSESTVIYLSDETGFPSPVIRKQLAAPFPTAAQIMRLENEHRIASVFNSAKLRKVVKPISVDGFPALLLEFVPGRPLHDLMPEAACRCRCSF